MRRCCISCVTVGLSVLITVPDRFLGLAVLTFHWKWQWVSPVPACRLLIPKTPEVVPEFWGHLLIQTLPGEDFCPRSLAPSSPLLSWFPLSQGTPPLAPLCWHCRRNPANCSSRLEGVCLSKGKLSTFLAELGFHRASGIGSAEENSSDASLHLAC